MRGDVGLSGSMQGGEGDNTLAVFSGAVQSDIDGAAVRLDDGDSLVGRLGLSVEARRLFGAAIATGSVEANLLHEFLADNQVTAGAVR